MKPPFDVEIAEKCWKDSLQWTYNQIDILNSVYDGKGKIQDLERSRGAILANRQTVLREKERIGKEAEKIYLAVKPVRNFQRSLERLLNSTEIDYSRSMKVPPPPFDLYDITDDQEVSEPKMREYVSMVKRNLEKNWVAFNQSFGRMLIKVKLNDYTME